MLNIEKFRDYCLSRQGEITEHFPFDEHILVFKVFGKMFALTDIRGFVSINLKCDPDRAVQLREQYPGIQPGYHMHKQQWNTVSTEGSVPDDLLLELIDHSHEQVVAKLPKKIQKLLE